MHRFLFVWWHSKWLGAHPISSSVGIFGLLPRIKPLGDDAEPHHHHYLFPRSRIGEAVTSFHFSTSVFMAWVLK
jgi:hypothetical protein